MGADQLNRASGAGLVALSLAALLAVLVGAYGALFGEQNAFRQTDEGTLAHLFQLSIVALFPVGLLFLATADWTRPLRAARPLVLPAVALVLAFVLLYYFERA